MGILIILVCVAVIAFVIHFLTGEFKAKQSQETTDATRFGLETREMKGLYRNSSAVSRARPNRKRVLRVNKQTGRQELGFWDDETIWDLLLYDYIYDFVYNADEYDAFYDENDVELAAENVGDYFLSDSYETETGQDFVSVNFVNDYVDEFDGAKPSEPAPAYETPSYEPTSSYEAPSYDDSYDSGGDSFGGGWDD